MRIEMRLPLQHFCVSLLLVLLWTLPAGAADIESAKRAYHQGDFPTAAKEFTSLAQHGNWEAQLILGKMYMLGQGVPNDSDSAIKWFRPVAEQGNSEAQFLLGSLLFLPKKDISDGIKWLRLSAEQGDQDAQLLLGKAYIKGFKELPRDPVQGDMWLRLSARDNKEFYQGELRAEERTLTAEQLAKGKELAALWKPKKVLSPTEHSPQ